MNSIVAHSESNCTVLHSCSRGCKFNMLVRKDGEVVQCGSDKSHWPFRGWMEVTGPGVAVLFGVGIPYPNCGSDTGIHRTWRIGQEVEEHVYRHRQSGSFNSPGDIEESWHNCTQPTDALSRTSWQAGVCTDHQEPATCFPVEIPESCPEASTSSWSNNWDNWWPVLRVSCGWLLAQRFWQISVGPHLFSGPYFLLWSWYWDTIVAYERELIHLYNGTISLFINLLIPEL